MVFKKKAITLIMICLFDDTYISTIDLINLILINLPLRSILLLAIYLTMS